jgi:PilZ domain
MTERRHAHRYELFIPLQVNSGSANFPESRTAHLRDISTRGLYFIGENCIAPGTHLEITFALPPERGRSRPVLVRGSGRALRVDPVPGEQGRLFGIAASFHRFDFVPPEERAA